MDLNGLTPAVLLVFGILSVIGLANVLDCGLRTMAENKAERAESCRFRRWGLPAPQVPEPPRNDEHLWHF